MWHKRLFWNCAIASLVLISHFAQANSVYYGPTTNQDHFWQIVDKFHSSNAITRQQMAVAVLRANSSAFSDGNVNALRNGQMLRIPSVEEMQQINPQTAAQLVDQMNQSWQTVHPGQNTGGLKTSITLTPLPFKNSTPPSPPPLENSNPPTTLAAMGVSNTNTAALQQQLQDTQQQLRQLEQQVTLQVSKLVQQNLSMQAQLANNNQVLEWVLEQMQKNNPGASHQPPLTLWSNKSLRLSGQPLPVVEKQHNNKLAFGVIALVVLALLGIWLPRQKNKLAQRSEPSLKESNLQTDAEPLQKTSASALQQPASQTTQEYDFLSGQEGIVAKLNLARVYLDMEDFATASQYIVEVMAHGNEEQRHAAEQLQQRLPALQN